MTTLLKGIGNSMIIGADDGTIQAISYNEANGRLDRPIMISKEIARKGHFYEEDNSDKEISDNPNPYMKSNLVKLSTKLYWLGNYKIKIVAGKGIMGWYLYCEQEWLG